MKAIGNIRDIKSVGTVVDALKDDHSMVRIRAIETLGILGYVISSLNQKLKYVQLVENDLVIYNNK